mmetsp:Transcript_39391/g.112728  ORF Transcript_39391/g.112728 Transcript_39391/m.112728 type:complete len:286 (-) Transcript_39391:82-939(-)
MGFRVQVLYTTTPPTFSACTAETSIILCRLLRRAISPSEQSLRANCFLRPTRTSPPEQGASTSAASKASGQNLPANAASTCETAVQGIAPVRSRLETSALERCVLLSFASTPPRTGATHATRAVVLPPGAAEASKTLAPSGGPLGKASARAATGSIEAASWTYTCPAKWQASRDHDIGSLASSSPNSTSMTCSAQADGTSSKSSLLRTALPGSTQKPLPAAAAAPSVHGTGSSSCQPWTAPKRRTVSTVALSGFTRRQGRRNRREASTNSDHEKPSGSTAARRLA